MEGDGKRKDGWMERILMLTNVLRKNPVIQAPDELSKGQ